jgi:hypothetical protein
MFLKSKYKFREIPVPAISEGTLPEVLRKLGLYNDVVNGKSRCYICGRQLTLESIGAIAMIDNKPVLVCDKPSCIGKATSLIKSQRQPGITQQSPH